MRRLRVSLIVVALFLSGCIPIGVRMGTQPDLGSAGPAMPDASAVPSLGDQRRIGQAAEEHRSDAGQEQRSDLEAGKVVDAAKTKRDREDAYEYPGDARETPDPQEQGLHLSGPLRASSLSG